MDFKYLHAVGFFLGPVITWVILIIFPFESLGIAQAMAIGAFGGFYVGHLVDKQTN